MGEQNPGGGSREGRHILLARAVGAEAARMVEEEEERSWGRAVADVAGEGDEEGQHHMEALACLGDLQTLEEGQLEGHRESAEVFLPRDPWEERWVGARHR